MKVFHIDQFKCTLCSNWFCPPFTLPYRLKCTHSICTNCLEKSASNHSNSIICPEDLQINQISDIIINQSTKKALERLLKQHKNFTQTDHLQCIKSLSIAFDQLLDSKQVQFKNLSTLIDQIFENQIKRLKEIYQKIKMQIKRPFRVVDDWKEVVRSYIKKIKSQGSKAKGSVSQFNHYIEEGRKIKLDLNQYMKHDFKDLIDHLLIQPQICFTHSFSIFDKIANSERKNDFSMGKFETLGKKFVTLGKKVQDERQVYLQDVTNNFDQSSIMMGKKTIQNDRSSSNRLSLFQQLIQETPKNQKYSSSQQLQGYQDSKQTPLKQMIFSSVQNLSNQKQANEKTEAERGMHINSQFRPSNCSNIKYNENNIEKVNFSTLESTQNNYNSVILEKINKTKQKNQQQSTKKPNRMGKSLEYSPDEPNYEVFQYDLNDYFGEQGKSYRNAQQLSLPSFYEDQSSHKITGPLETKSVSEFRPSNQKQTDEPEEQFLLDEKSNRNDCVSQKLRKNEWSLEHLNFLKEWKIEKDGKKVELQVIQKYGGYDCEKEKNKYARKIQELRVKQILRETIINYNYISIVGQNLAECNLLLLLGQIDWNYRNIEIVKFIKTGLSDLQLNQLLNFLVRSKVHTLMLSYNNLTELSLDALLHFVSMNSTLKSIYLPKNNISLLKGNARTKINLLKQKGINLYI